MAMIIEISDLSSPELSVYARLTEAQLRNQLHPADGIFIAESEKVITCALNAGYEPVSFLMERRHITGKAAHLIARCPSKPIYTAPREVLMALTGYPLTRGILSAMRRKPLIGMETLCRNARRICVLEGIVDATNLGAIFRSAAALGMDVILLTPNCCDPLNRRAARVSMGAVFQVPWTHIGNTGSDWPRTGLAWLSQIGFKTVALALTDRSTGIDDPSIASEPRLAIILGNEGNGLNRETLALCDYIAKIPMTHGVDSLNVAAAGAIAFYVLGR